MRLQLLHLQQLGMHYWRQNGPERREQEEPMEFGYFTLSDNHYENNPRDANQFVSDITAEALK